MPERENNINGLEEIHCHMQQDMFIDRTISFNDALIVYSSLIKDWYWNYVTKIQNINKNIPKYIEMIENKMISLDRTPCIYLNSKNTLFLDYDKYLINRGYKNVFKDVWMTLGSVSKTKYPIHRLQIKRVENEKMLNEFLKIFFQVYGGEPTPEQPYGNLPKEYGDCINRSYNKDRDGKRFIHMIGYDNQTPICIATLAFYGDFAGLYNVGTIPTKKKMGYGGQISKYMCKFALEHAKKVFLLTEYESYNQQFYINLGFIPLFTCIAYAKDNTRG